MLVEVVLPLSLAIIMFSLGLGLTIADFTRVLTIPRAVLTGFVLQILGIPLIGYLLLQVADLPPAMAFGFMILAFCPGGFSSAILAKIAGGTVALSVTLTAIASLVSVITVPLFVAWAAVAFLGEAALEVNVTSLALAMFLLTTAPVVLGMLVHRFATGFANRIEKGMNIVSVILFAAVVIAAVVLNWATFMANIGLLGPVTAVFVVIAVALGVIVPRLLRLNGPDATCISIELGVQNGTLGIAVVGLITVGAGLSEYAIPSAVYGVMMYLVIVPLIFAFRKMSARG